MRAQRPLQFASALRVAGQPTLVAWPLITCGTRAGLADQL